jgi:hypothetical protein
MEKLKGYQKKYLKGLIHGMKPVVFKRKIQIPKRKIG